MLREINKIITDDYIPFAFHFGTNYSEAADRDSLAKDCLRVVIYKLNQSPDTGFVMNITKVNHIWLHTTSTTTSTMDIACSCSLSFDQEMLFPLNTHGRLCVDIDIIKVFKNLIVFTDYNKYNIDPTILWDNINFSDGLSYRIYDTTMVGITFYSQHEDHYSTFRSDIYDTPAYRIKSAGISVDSATNVRIPLTPVIPNKLVTIRFNFNTTMHIMSDVFSIKNLDLLKKKP